MEGLPQNINYPPTFEIFDDSFGEENLADLEESADTLNIYYILYDII